MNVTPLPRFDKWQDWHIPWSEDQITLRQALDSLAPVAASPQEIPLLVRLVENPRYRIPGITLFHGAVDLKQHDCIHALLGRGLLAKDEAFVIGFTMGSTGAVSTVEETLFTKISKYCYPKIYKFDDEDVQIFRDAVKLGAISCCDPLDTADFQPLLDLPLRQARQRLGIEGELIEAYYKVEKRRFPAAKASQRLI